VIWTHKYDRSIEDLFEVQDEITRNVTGSIGGQVRRATMEIASFDPPRSRSARTIEGALPVLLTGTVIASTPQSARLSMTIVVLLMVFIPSLTLWLPKVVGF
jgi:hypothetical protein